MELKSYKNQESEKKLTFLNAMTAIRAVGGIGLGVSMASWTLNPLFVVLAAASLGALDAESSVLQATNRFPRFQRAMRIFPTKIGRIADPISDKIYAVSIFAGGLASGSIPVFHGLGILITELLTAIITAYSKLKGFEPEVSKIGKVGMVARCGVIGFDLAAVAVSQPPRHRMLVYVGYASAIAAILLGTVSFYKIYRDLQTKLHKKT
jgi:hypothetical protein